MAAIHPKFVRQNRSVDKRVGEAWRKPRGIDNKQRVMLKWCGALPCIGYRSPKDTRGMRNGKMLKVVHNEAELAAVDAKNDVIYFAATIGKKKRAVLLAAAQKKGVRVLNSGIPRKNPADKKEAAKDAAKPAADKKATEAPKAK
ncbi:MAG: eL32 family ribosomal protein [Candidatus Micrarchaeia archaeon]